MPFITHAMARSMRGSQTVTVKSGKNIRTMPGIAPNGASVVYEDPDANIKSAYRYEISLRKLFFVRSLVQAQYEQLMAVTPANSISENRSLFETFRYDQPLEEDVECDRVFRASCSTEGNQPLVVRIYPTSEIDPNSLYLRIMRHIFKKYVYILRTYEIFYDSSDVYIFQEMIDLGSMVDYLNKGSALSEKQALIHGKQLWRALDFLGDQAIAHRNIMPSIMMLKWENQEILLKLTGFRSAMIYWDPKNNDINYCPCVPVERHRTNAGQFQAPEVYGNPGSEEFDPIMADTWSFGGCIYYMLTKSYPYNYEGECQDLDGEIGNNINKINSLSAQGKKSLYQLLRANANNRIPFDCIRKDPWIQSASSRSASFRASSTITSLASTATTMGSTVSSTGGSTVGSSVSSTMSTKTKKLDLIKSRPSSRSGAPSSVQSRSAAGSRSRAPSSAQSRSATGSRSPSTGIERGKSSTSNILAGFFQAKAKAGGSTSGTPAFAAGSTTASTVPSAGVSTAVSGGSILPQGLSSDGSNTRTKQLTKVKSKSGGGSTFAAPSSAGSTTVGTSGTTSIAPSTVVSTATSGGSTLPPGFSSNGSNTRTKQLTKVKSKKIKIKSKSASSTSSKN